MINKKFNIIFFSSFLCVCFTVIQPRVIYAQIKNDVPKENKESAKNNQPDGTTHTDEKQKIAISKGKVMLGIGSTGLYAIGGGETHKGQEIAGINPMVFLSISYFLVDGFAIGLQGAYQYAHVRISMEAPFIPGSLKTTVHSHSGAVGILAYYFFKATNALYPYIGIMAEYGGGTGTVMNRKLSLSQWTFGATVGINYMVAQNLGLFLDVNHIRDIINTGSGNMCGYITAINLGFKFFL